MFYNFKRENLKYFPYIFVSYASFNIQSDFLSIKIVLRDILVFEAFEQLVVA